jgi:Flp pilus assembly protein TadG
MIAPIFCLIFVGTIDFGGALYVKFNLTGTVSAAANYAMINSANVNSSSGTSLATNLANLAASNHASNWANATIIVNNGPTATITGGTLSSSGTAANANSCYCPTVAGTTITWGSAITCGNVCSGGGIAGKFVSITASKTYTPIFPVYGFVTASAITARTVVETN